MTNLECVVTLCLFYQSKGWLDEKMLNDIAHAQNVSVEQLKKEIDWND